MQGGHLIRLGLVAAGIAAALGVAGCSDDGEERPPESRHPAAAAVRELQAAFAARDMARICEQMTPTAQRQAGEVAHGTPTTCEKDLRRAFRIIDEGGWGESGEPIVTRAVVDGPRATATVEHDEGWRANVELMRIDGVWKLAGFFGVPPKEFDLFEDRLRRYSPGEGGGQSVEVLDRDGEPCPPVRLSAQSKVAGGCVFEVTTGSVPIRMLTPFGDFRFANCSVDYRVTVSPEGDTWTTDAAFEKPNTGCSDLNPCVTERDEEEEKPWQGKLVSDGDGGYVHHMILCLRTCIGLFAGDFFMRLDRDDEGWKVETSDEGATGFKIDGELAVSGEPFDVSSG